MTFCLILLDFIHDARVSAVWPILFGVCSRLRCSVYRDKKISFLRCSDLYRVGLIGICSRQSNL